MNDYKMTAVNFHNYSYDPGCRLTYSVIGARYSGEWIHVRHHLRTSTEIPGGHIEEGETADEAASRELMEETGAIDFSIHPVATYSVTKNGMTGWGKLYFAEVNKIGPIPDTSEIAEVVMADHLLVPNTHPDIQPLLFRRILDYLGENRIRS
jgi:8-oxo-dGTP diphosphatase